MEISGVILTYGLENLLFYSFILPAPSVVGRAGKSLAGDDKFDNGRLI